MYLYLLWHSRATRTLLHGVTWGVGCGAFALLWPSPVGVALAVGVVGGVMFGLFLAWRSWRKWPTADRLRPADRVTIGRAVRRGEAIAKPALASPTIELATTIHYTTLNEMRQLDQFRWLNWGLAGFWTLRAVMASFDESGAHPAVYWTLAAMFGWAVTFQTPYLRRVASNAERALNAARATAMASAGTPL